MKKLRTTALIEKKYSAMIDQACRKRKIKQTTAINTAIRSMVSSRISANHLKTYSTVKYQNRGKKYIVIHFSIDPELYEACIELRKTNKLSVSFMINAWIKEYFNNSKETQLWFSIFFFKVDNKPILYHIKSEFTIRTQTLHTCVTIKLE
ncbi:MAG: hypothetical protein KA015_02600 [Spirochaetes bacterium]|nr:hypothetical protein [Spirochaetota bacterium]